MLADDLVAHLPALRAEARQLREQESKVREQAARVERVIEAIEGLRAQPPSPTRQNGRQARGPTGIAAVRRVMSEAGGRVWRPREVHEVLEKRGWVSPHAQHPVNGTENSINRLWKRGEVEKLGPGRYRYRRREESLTSV
jgi:hypothetical protein